MSAASNACMAGNARLVKYAAKAETNAAANIRASSRGTGTDSAELRVERAAQQQPLDPRAERCAGREAERPERHARRVESSERARGDRETEHA